MRINFFTRSTLIVVVLLSWVASAEVVELSNYKIAPGNAYNVKRFVFQSPEEKSKPKIEFDLNFESRGHQQHAVIYLIILYPNARDTENIGFLCQYNETN